MLAGQTQALPFQLVIGGGQRHWLTFESHFLGSGHGVHDGPNVPAGQTHAFPFQTKGASQSHLLFNHLLGNGHGSQLAP